MRKFFNSGIIVLVLFILSACAQSYQPINPHRLNLTSSNGLENITLNYRYDVLMEKGNDKNAKKERANNVKLVAVRITNNTSQVLNIGNNAAFYTGNTVIYPMDPISLSNALKQSVPSHLLYLLFAPLTLSVNGSDPFPIGLLLGPGLSGGNMIAASKANKNLYSELKQYDIMFRDIKPGESVIGLVGFRDIDYVPLTIKLFNL